MKQLTNGSLQMTERSHEDIGAGGDVVDDLIPTRR